MTMRCTFVAGPARLSKCTEYMIGGWEGEIEVERSPPTGKSFRFVRARERAGRSCVGGREKCSLRCQSEIKTNVDLDRCSAVPRWCPDGVPKVPRWFPSVPGCPGGPQPPYHPKGGRMSSPGIVPNFNGQFISTFNEFFIQEISVVCTLLCTELHVCNSHGSSTRNSYRQQEHCIAAVDLDPFFEKLKTLVPEGISHLHLVLSKLEM